MVKFAAVKLMLCVNKFKWLILIMDHFIKFRLKKYIATQKM